MEKGRFVARKSDNHPVRYDEWAMKLGVEFYRHSEVPVRLLYHLMKGKRLHSFSAIMLRSPMEGFGEFLRTHKRKTDLLYEVAPEEGVYALFCQETQVDGGYYFMQRLMGLMEQENNPDFHAAIVGVESTIYPVQDLIFIVLDDFVELITEEEPLELITFRTVK